MSICRHRRSRRDRSGPDGRRASRLRKRSSPRSRGHCPGSPPPSPASPPELSRSSASSQPPSSSSSSFSFQSSFLICTSSMICSIDPKCVRNVSERNFSKKFFNMSKAPPRSCIFTPFRAMILLCEQEDFSMMKCVQKAGKVLLLLVCTWKSGIRR